MADTSSQIADLEVERNQNLDRAKVISSIAGDASRDLTAEEQSSQSAYLDRVEAIDSELSTLSRIEKLEASRAVPVAASAEPAADAAIEVNHTHREPGMIFAQMAACMNRARGSRHDAAQYAKEVLGDEFLSRVLAAPPGVLDRADPGVGDTSTAAYAGVLVREYQRQASEFIELLNGQTVYGQLGARTLNFNGAPGIKVPRMTSGPSASFVGEGAAIPVTDSAFDEITLEPKKMGALIVLNRELAERSDPAAVGIIRDEMVESSRLALNVAFLGGGGATATTPMGIFNQSQAGMTASATANALDDATADMKNLMTTLAATNKIPGPYVWAMGQDCLISLMYMRDANGQYAFRDELNAGRLAGHTYVVDNSTTMADDLALFAPNQILIANGKSPTVDMSTEATLHRETVPTADIGGAATPVQSLYQTDALALRLLLEIDWSKRHDWACSVITAVTWN